MDIFFLVALRPLIAGQALGMEAEDRISSNT